MLPGRAKNGSKSSKFQLQHPRCGFDTLKHREFAQRLKEYARSMVGPCLLVTYILHSRATHDLFRNVRGNRNKSMYFNLDKNPFLPSKFSHGGIGWSLGVSPATEGQPGPALPSSSTLRKAWCFPCVAWVPGWFMFVSTPWN